MNSVVTHIHGARNPAGPYDEPVVVSFTQGGGGHFDAYVNRATCAFTPNVFKKIAEKHHKARPR